MMKLSCVLAICLQLLLTHLAASKTQRDHSCLFVCNHCNVGVHSALNGLADALQRFQWASMVSLHSLFPHE